MRSMIALTGTGRSIVMGLLLLALACGLIAAGCGTDSVEIPEAGTSCTPDLASIRATIFEPTCATSACHSATGKAAGMDLGAADLAAQLVDVPSGTCTGWIRVVPGSADKSMLYQKIAGTPPCGAKMPLGGSTLTDVQKACIKQWIADLPPPDGGMTHDSGADASCGDTQTNASNCGSCGHVCPSGAACTAGVCGCSGSLTACGQACVNTGTSSSNCGKCGNVCPSGASCTAGACVCPATASTDCSGTCVSLQSDGSDCGACGKVCGSGTVCNQGSCTSGCGSLTQCGQSCVDTTTSFDNCGGCGKICPSGASCVASTCVCPSGTSACGGSCINTSTDSSNCGG